ncbi:MAG: hypothetical protein KGL39_27105 [Patescibacteria group bacterium]|nr:hypothetical protein [Patescibacteria group bacterium]
MKIKQDNGTVNILTGSPWTRSLIEEIISALWFIVSILAYSVGFHVVAVLFAIKAVMDTIISIGLAIKETLDEKEEFRDQTNQSRH